MSNTYNSLLIFADGGRRQSWQRWNTSLHFVITSPTPEESSELCSLWRHNVCLWSLSTCGWYVLSQPKTTFKGMHWGMFYFHIIIKSTWFETFGFLPRKCSALSLLNKSFLIMLRILTVPIFQIQTTTTVYVCTITFYVHDSISPSLHGKTSKLN